MTRKLLTEVIGTFFLVLTIGLTVTAGLPLAPLAIGAALMVMVYMGGAISGAHYNPAVTVAVLLRGKIAVGEAAAYMVAQVAGATLAALAVYGIVGQTFVPAPAAGASAAVVLGVEALFTFALALVVLNVATTRETAGNSYFGLAIGLTVMAGAFAGGPVSGGAFNPAVGLGPAIVTALLGSAPVAHVWFYVAGPIVGAALAAAAFRVQHPAEFEPVSVPFPAGLKQSADEPAVASEA
ncbi:MIP/aquaporin family protein [Longimicrobium sp.]|uniref:MIP/aquaporin family protein n=1 Tax=Longimicrobium sp. TaxID=2029185 RepID=UPI002BF2A9AA|nr:aquaporin [Longimicrobium sp.]HSU17660.1 aquaporin [Longimicrobium sp.]